MLPWKPLLAVVPAGLLLGLVAGHASRPEMVIKDERPWPQSLNASAGDVGRWPTFDLSTPEIASRGYSYRPDIDYDLYVWPDQTDRSAELVAADVEYGSFDGAYDARLESDEELPLTRRAVAELAGRQAERLALDTSSVAPVAREDTGSREAPSGSASAVGAAFVLPPVPPPLATVGELPDEPDTGEGEVF
ncbi:MAG: hypothetical protein ACO1OD_09485 [Croceibacterium sp.]